MYWVMMQRETESGVWKSGPFATRGAAEQALIVLLAQTRERNGFVISNFSVGHVEKEIS